MKFDKILLEHGGGGRLSNELIAQTFLPLFNNKYLASMEDSASFIIGNQKLCFTTDSYVVDPIFFPGGDIGSLAVHGTVNDLSVCGARPLFLSTGFILEEGFDMADLEKIVASMADAAKQAGVYIVTGDTKVVPRGAADSIFINTAGIGLVDYEGILSVGSIREGDAIIASGTIGDHGAAILIKRENMAIESDIVSDSSPLNGLVEKVLAASPQIHCMRDATRGGVGAILAEIAARSGLEFRIHEESIPVKDSVRGICEMLGVDPLFLANEGKIVVFCPEGDAANVLKAMNSHEYGRDAAVIGTVNQGNRGRLLLKTLIGGSREIDLPTGELVPRIC